MRLKLLAPFAISGLRLCASRIAQSPDAYAGAWDAAAARARDGLTAIPGLPVEGVEALRFTHASPYCHRDGSRYRTIHEHSLPRPLHAIETILALPGEASVSTLERAEEGLVGEGSPRVREVAGAWAEAFRAAPPRALVRVFGHGVALIEVDLPIPARLLQADAGGDDPGAVGQVLDAVQQLGIAFAEALVDRIGPAHLAPIFAWVASQEELAVRFVEPGAARDRTAKAVGFAPMWVTRSLILDDPAEAPPEAAGGASLRRAVVEHWLKDVSDAGPVVERCVSEPNASSTAWLNYFFGEASYAGEYPADGWRERSGDDRENAAALPLSPTWDAVLIAQYYYAAFDRLQSKISYILAVSVSGEGRRRIADVKADLDAALRDANMLKIEFDENGKYYARRVATEVESILANWGFEQRLRSQIDQRIRECNERLSELHSRALERSSIYTDLILLAIGITAVFEVLLSLAEYGRTMSADPHLAVYDRTSLLNVARWIGANSTDVVLLAAAVFSIGLIALYAYFRAARSNV